MILRVFLISFLGTLQAAAQEDQILERGEKLLEEAKAAYEDARARSSVAAFVDAGFKLEEARIKFIVLQEIGAPEKQKIAADRLRAVNQLSKLSTTARSPSVPDAFQIRPGQINHLCPKLIFRTSTIGELYQRVNPFSSPASWRPEVASQCLPGVLE